MRNVGHHETTKSSNYRVDKGEESQVNGTDQIFSKTIEGNFPKYKKHTEHQTGKKGRQNIHGTSYLKHYKCTLKSVLKAARVKRCKSHKKEKSPE